MGLELWSERKESLWSECDWSKDRGKAGLGKGFGAVLGEGLGAGLGAGANYVSDQCRGEHHIAMLTSITRTRTKTF